MDSEEAEKGSYLDLVRPSVSQGEELACSKSSKKRLRGFKLRSEKITLAPKGKNELKVRKSRKRKTNLDVPAFIWM